MIPDQHEFDVRLEWGEHGVATLSPISDAIIIVDVLSFSTCVDIAVSRGATVFPYRGAPDQAAEFAASVQAIVAGRERDSGRFSLSPESLLHLAPGTRIVLPSLNGSILSLSAGATPVLAGCLRNARAVASAAQRMGTRIAVIAAGERWQDDHTLRPSFEDLVGAGAIISHLSGSKSPEALSAEAAFHAVEMQLSDYLHQCSSGRELIDQGFARDVNLASQIDASNCAPMLRETAFQN